MGSIQTFMLTTSQGLNVKLM